MRAESSPRETLGRAGAVHRDRLRRFRCLDHARHHSRRPHRLCAVLQSAAFRRASRQRSSRSGTAACRFTAASPDARSPSSCLRGDGTSRPCRSATSHCAVAPIGLFLGRIANFINGELWGRPTDVPWAMIFPHGGPMPRHPSQLYEACARRRRAVHRPRRAGARRRPEAAGRRHRDVLHRLRHGAHDFANSFANPTCSSASCGARDG